jgi:hypothetical protein
LAFPASWRVRLSALAFFAEMRKKELKQMPQSLTQMAYNLCNFATTEMFIISKY